MEQDPTQIVIVGCGPGSPDYVTPLAHQAVEKAEILVGALRLLELFPTSQAEKIAVGRDIDDVLEKMAEGLGKKRITVLVSGDPGLCSLAQPIVKRFGRERCQVIAGVSSVQVAFAHLGLEWLNVRLINAHGSDPDIDARALADVDGVAVFLGREGSRPWIRRFAERLGEGHRLFVCENLTLPGERVREVKRSDLDSLPFVPRMIALFVRKDQLQ
jgi:precorrin-6y C5,15-methyltransferase (decarboxylating) CbiE subunit